MLSSRIKKAWLEELKSEVEKLHAEYVTLDEEKNKLGERIAVLEELQATWEQRGPKVAPHLLEEGAKELQNMKEELDTVEKTVREKRSRLQFVEVLKRNVERQVEKEEDD